MHFLLPSHFSFTVQKSHPLDVRFIFFLSILSHLLHILVLLIRNSPAVLDSFFFLHFCVQKIKRNPNSFPGPDEQSPLRLNNC